MNTTTTTVLGKAYQFQICLRADKLTAHAGIVLLRDFIGKLGVPELLDEQIHVKARARLPEVGKPAELVLE